MKKLITISMILLIASSCVKHPTIIRKLSEEDAAAIPYKTGQTVKFLDQNNDTLTFQVTRDVTYPYNEVQLTNAIIGEDVMHTPQYSYNCYARTVVLTCNQGGKQLGFTILPKKEFVFSYVTMESNFNLNGYLLPNGPFTINGTDYTDVHTEILYSQYTEDLIYNWYYNEEYGLLYFKKGDFSITRIP